MDFSIEQLFSQNDPVISRYLNFREEFDGVDNRIFLLYESDDPFSYNNLLPALFFSLLPNIPNIIGRLPPM